MNTGRPLQTMQISSTYPVIKPQLKDADAKRKTQAPASRQIDEGLAAKRFKGDAENLDHHEDSLATVAPSDFSSFNANIRSNNMVIGRSSQYGTMLPPQGSGVLSTFLDIASKAQSSATEGAPANKFHESWRNMEHTANHMIRANSCNNGNGGEGGILAGAGPSIGSAQEHQVSHLPYDWVPKRSLRFLTQRQLSVFDQLQRLDPSQVALSRQAFSVGGEFLESLPHALKLHAALSTWRYPETTWDPASVKALLAALPAGSSVPSATLASSSAATGPGLAAITGGASEHGRNPASGIGALLSHRLSTWRAALRSVYLLLRSGVCPAFYVSFMGSKPYSVLFCATGARGCPASLGPHAIVSQSTKVLRSKLAGTGVQYTLPLAPLDGDIRLAQQAAKLRRIDSDEEDEPIGDREGVTAGLAAPRGSWTAAKDHTPESLLMISGAQSVHGLLDFLLNELNWHQQQLLGGRDAADLPLILAPVEFEGSTIQRSLPSIRGVATSEPQSSRAGGFIASAGSSCFEVPGPLPPWVVHRLVHVISDAAQGQQIHVIMDSDPSCLGLNVASPQPPSTQTEPSQLHSTLTGTWNKTEAAAVQDANVTLQKRVIKSALCQPGGVLKIKLS